MFNRGYKFGLSCFLQNDSREQTKDNLIIMWVYSQFKFQKVIACDRGPQFEIGWVSFLQAYSVRKKHSIVILLRIENKRTMKVILSRIICKVKEKSQSTSKALFLKIELEDKIGTPRSLGIFLKILVLRVMPRTQINLLKFYF